MTGLIFGFGTVWFAYPHMEERFHDIQQQLSAKLAEVKIARLGFISGLTLFILLYLYLA